MRRVAFLILLIAVPARAQRGEPATAGVYNPTIGIAGDADASSIEKNPAGIGFLRSWNGVYLHSELDEKQRVGGRGDGFFFAFPVPYFSAFSLGAAVQSIRPPLSFPYPNEAKLSLALAWRPSPIFAVGLHYAHLFSAKGPVAGGVDTLDLAFSLRPWRFLAAAMVVRDVPSPAVGNFPLQRVWEPEIALRLFGDRVEIAAAARFGERRGDVDPRFRLWVTPNPGIIIKTDIEWRRDVNLDGISENDVRVAIGVAVDLERVGANGFGLFGTDSDKVNGHGFTLAARVSGERYPTVWRGPTRFEKLDFGPGITGRKLAAMLLKLRRLERDRQIAGVVVVLGDLDGSWATAEELRAALLRIRHAKKHVFAYLTEANTRTYYVASAAQRLYQNPGGGIRITGFSSTSMYFKGTGELLGVKADFVKIAEYKAAPEQYTRSGPSEPAREQRQAMLDDVYRHVTEGIATARHVGVDEVRRWIDGGPYTAAQAQRLGLVDELRQGDEVETAIGEKLGRRVALGVQPTSPEHASSWLRPKIAAIFIDGDIVDGKSQTIPILNMRFSGMQTLLPAIARARDDGNVKAIVVRIDTPGGSALASDLINREIAKTAKVKPVLCSLGDVAASGGYFVAAACNKIFAAPSTLTGSIGIFTGKFDVSGLAAKLGVSLSTFERGRHASIESLYRPYTEEERVLILDRLRYYYRRFLDAVARGREMTPDAVDLIARGHIWSGEAAFARGLVDEYGSFADAVAEAKKEAGYGEDDRLDLEVLPDQPSLLTTLLGFLGINLSTSEVLALPGLSELLPALPGSLMMQPSTPQARLDEAWSFK